MAVNRGEVGSAPRLAALLLDDVDRLAEHAAGRMQKLLPSYAKVPRAQLVPIVRTNMRNVLEAIRDPAADTRRAQANFHTSGETRANQGISSDEMLHGWRIAQDSVHEHGTRTRSSTSTPWARTRCSRSWRPCCAGTTPGCAPRRRHIARPSCAS